MKHELKIFPWYYYAMVTNKKKFELRENDRNYKVGDILVLREYDPQHKKHTGHYLEVEVTYILRLDEFFNLDNDYVVMSIRKKY